MLFVFIDKDCFFESVRLPEIKKSDIMDLSKKGVFLCA